MEPTTGPDSAEVGAAAAAAVAPDAVTAELLAKHAAGEKLTQPQYGKLGAWKSKLGSLFGRKSNGDPGPAQPGPSPGHASPLAPLASAEASDSGLAAVPIDAALARRCTAIVLARCDSVAVRYVGTAAVKAGITGETLVRLERGAALSKDDKALMVDISPDVFASLGINPRNFPVALFLGTLGAWATDLWLVVEEIKALKKPAAKPETN
jgi:hypothetical protein